MDAQQFSGKIAFVTGAGAGIGRAAAIGLARRGADVGFLTRTQAHAEETRAQIEALGRHAVAVTGDVGRAEDVQAALRELSEALGGVDIAVANAGIDVDGTVASTSVQDWERIVATNLSGVFYTAKYAVDRMLPRGGGTIIIIGSDSSVWATQNLAAYTTVKHALVGLTRAMALDFGPHGIRTNIVCPTFVQTEMFDRFVRDNPRLAQLWLSGIPQGRPAATEEVVEVIAHLASEEARFTNGLVYNLDGGATAGMFRPPDGEISLGP